MLSAKARPYDCVGFDSIIMPPPKKTDASAGNRTRAARVAGEHSTTEPPMLHVGSFQGRNFQTFKEIFETNNAQLHGNGS